MGKQGRNNSKSGQQAASDLLNFHLPERPSSQQTNHHQPRRQNRKQSQHNRQQFNRSQHDRSSARRKPNASMFYLHSSADHAFVLTRTSQKQGHSYSGPDTPISWDSVRAVKYLSPASTTSSSPSSQNDDALSCPICLDFFVCARVTKCGHLFCAPCLLRHVQTHTAANPYAHVKCPCCGLPMIIDDIRPLLIETVQKPKPQTRMKFVKLHRVKDCPAPYLPQRDQLRHSSPYTAPMVTDTDAIYSRFTYIDPVVYQGLLASNQTELENDALLYKDHPGAVELVFIHMALERVRKDLNQCLLELEREEELMQQYAQSHVGMYQPIPPALFANTDESVDEHQRARGVSIGSEHDRQRPRGQSFGSEAEQRSRGQSFGSENDQRPRGESFGSEGDQHLGRADRDSHESRNTGAPRPKKERRLPYLHSSLYLQPSVESHFYQATDGQLCFLSKFNMNCLLNDFSTNIPELPPGGNLTWNERRSWNPLPDCVEGNVIEIEQIHLTPEMRKRLPFLSHLPLYTDISFVEIDLNRILSDDTKKKFKDEFEKRRKRRKNKSMQEKKSDLANKKKEEERINQLKARIQRIDPNDQFFRSPDPDPESVITGEGFGPSISGGGISGSPTQAHLDPELSFSSVIHTPSNVAITNEAFPTLGSPAIPQPRTPAPRPQWGQGWRAASVQPKVVDSSEEGLPISAGLSTASTRSKGKKSKGKKIVLFSTGGERGGY